VLNGTTVGLDDSSEDSEDDSEEPDLGCGAVDDLDDAPGMLEPRWVW